MTTPSQEPDPASSDEMPASDSRLREVEEFLAQTLMQRREARLGGKPKTRDELKQLIADCDAQHNELRNKLLRHGIDIDILSQGPVVTGAPLGALAMLLPDGIGPDDPLCVCNASPLFGNIALSDIDQDAVREACQTCRTRLRSLSVIFEGNQLGRNTVVEVACQRQHRLTRIVRLGDGYVALGSVRRERPQETLWWANHIPPPESRTLAPLDYRSKSLEYSCRCGTAYLAIANLHAWVASGRRRIPWATTSQIGQQLRSQLALNKTFTEDDVYDSYVIIREILEKIGLTEDQLADLPQVVSDHFAPHMWTPGPPKRSG